jgi:hypothetical protein
MPAITGAWHLIATAFSNAIDSMGTSALALIAGLAYFLFQTGKAHKKGGWPAVNAEWKGDAGRGILFTVCVCVGSA